MQTLTETAKQCRSCTAVLPLSSFYAHRKMSDGVLNDCKECHKTNVRARRAVMVDHYQAYDRARGRTGARRAKLDARKRDKRKAHLASVTVRNHTVRGTLTKQPCVVCGAEKADAHHEDYDRPLDVVWLCRSHHARRHAELAGKSDHGVWQAIGAARPF